jgi:hypothetical protein
MAKPKVFVSYDHSEDAHYKRLLQAWDANPEFDFEFDSRGPDVAIDSINAGVVKAALVRNMKSATHLLVLVGAKSSKSKWMTWEIDRAKEGDIKLKLAAVKLARDNLTPAGLLNAGTSWATSFTRDRIVEALRGAKAAWRYAMKAEPYDGSDQAARTLFIDDVRKILSDNKAAESAIASSDGRQITQAMEELRAKTLLERRTEYGRFRIENQLDWYRKKARFNKTRGERWVAVLAATQLLAIVCLLLKIRTPSHFWPTDVLVAATGAGLAWVQTKRFQELAASYSLTVHDISLLQAKLSDARTDANFSLFVGDAENAFSREHIQWRARRDVA